MASRRKQEECVIAEDQTAAVAFLSAPASYGITEPIETMETHISRIFLVGRRAFKMKRAVKLPYVDFSTARLRLDACQKEVELNSATAPGLYLGVRRITREKDGTLAFDGHGELLDAVVEMARFDQQALFDRMAVEGRLTPELMTVAAQMIARFHRAAPVVHEGGGAANIAGVLRINAAGFATSRVFQPAELGAFTLAFDRGLARHATLLDRREAAGKVRRCHGDLHLRNICLFEGAPRLFDCIEFNDQIATVDTLYDLAFLLMDLWHRGFPDLANLVMNRYLDESDDEDGFVLLPYLMAIRAAVRAHVTATQVEESGEASAKLVAEARSYFDLARLLIQPVPVRLIAIGGFSGSGKTTVAETLAARVGAAPGARIVESDRVRKAMHRVSAETRLPPSAYRPEVSEKVYREMAERARPLLAAGGTVIVDAVFDKPENRNLMEKLAGELGIPLTAVWLDAEATLLCDRVASRSGGPSDADVDVLSGQLARDSGERGWRRIDAARGAEQIAAEILNLPISYLGTPQP
ncbi:MULTISPECIES: bifunctional aminoglycoside phosphotransferase/ATP-binding protein [unclassified Sinorhizobium]|uniref:bifunctional aminoglycoside phosphotransferase/ATP-binding protein n=1 Tax=unclassified Sinorhizobium TaxID=2613772 RepID=UPI0024C317F2|nr:MULTISPECIES: bifunctional aminoglycoside phosphotransferase/ATP-binding protein [unclassified Sinorhizobium]MDK1373872.1 AAA family ATPase [Sinorhizobium sp. 6-70]MDK1481096.1 AAA family ATPase [Sinorhizobium sp. 6-117]